MRKAWVRGYKVVLLLRGAAILGWPLPSITHAIDEEAATLKDPVHQDVHPGTLTALGTAGGGPGMTNQKAALERRHQSTFFQFN